MVTTYVLAKGRQRNDGDDDKRYIYIYIYRCTSCTSLTFGLLDVTCGIQCSGSILG